MLARMPRKDEILDVDVEGLDHRGRGLVTLKLADDTVMAPHSVTIPGALPGERVRLRVGAIRKRHGHGTSKKKGLIPVIEPFNWRERFIRPGMFGGPPVSSLSPHLQATDARLSPSERPAICPHFDKRHDEKSCNRCPLAHMNYPVQRVEKLRLFRKNLGQHWKNQSISFDASSHLTHTQPFWESQVLWAGRGKPPILGQWSRGEPAPGERRRPVATPDCVQANKTASKVLTTIGSLLQSGNWPAWDERWDSGILRSVIVKTTINTSGKPEVLVNLVSAFPNKGEVLKPLAQAIAAAEPSLVKGVVLNVSRSSTRDLFNLGWRQELLWGRDRIEHSVSGRSVLIGGGALPAHAINSELLGYMKTKAAGVVWDCWAGSGTVSAAVSESATKLVSLEGFPGRLADLQRNFENSNVKVVHADLRNVDTLIDLGRAVHRYRALQLLLEGVSDSPPLPPDSSSFYRRIERLSLARFSQVPDDVKRVLLAESSDNAELADKVNAYIDSCDPYKPSWMKQGDRLLAGSSEDVSTDDDSDGSEFDEPSVGEESPRGLVPSESNSAKAGLLPPPDTVLISFPPEDSKTKRKGSLSKEFRRFIRSVGAKRIVIASPDASALSKDMGHLELLGYAIESIKIFDTEPHSMKLQAVAVLNLVT